MICDFFVSFFCIFGLFDAVTVVMVINGEVASSLGFFLPPFLLEGASHPIAVVLLCIILCQ